MVAGALWDAVGVGDFRMNDSFVRNVVIFFYCKNLNRENQRVGQVLLLNLKSQMLANKALEKSRIPKSG